MRRLRIDFAPSSARTVIARMHPFAWLAVAAALGAGVHVAIVYDGLMRQRQSVAGELQRLQSRLATQAAARQPPPKAPIPQEQAHAVNAAIAQLNLPWRDMLDAVEAATPATIALVALEPDAKKRIVKGTAEAKTGEAMIAYIEDLKKQPFFRFVALTKHEINAQDPNKPLRFQFEAQWGEGS
jgi:Tfp pilus assembly protein PilN